MFALYTTIQKFGVSTFTFTYLADAFIQSDLQCIQAIHIFCQYMCSLGIEPTTFALLTQCSNHWATGTVRYFLNKCLYIIDIKLTKSDNKDTYY